MFRLSATKCHRVTAGSEAMVRAIWLTKSSSVRVGPMDGVTTVPCATSKLAINVTVPRRIYSNSRRSACPGSMSRGGCVRSSAWMPVISSVDSTRSPASTKAGACPYNVVRSAIFTSASATNAPCAGKEEEMYTVSLWSATHALPDFPAIDRDIEVDVVVVGTGLTGITTAYLLKQAGARVALIERERIAPGHTH